MPLPNKKFRLWFLRFGKVKGGILYFLYLVTVISIFGVAFNLIKSLIYGTSFIEEISDISLGIILLLLWCGIAAVNFHSETVKELRYDEELDKKGLTQEDVWRIAFLKEWAIKRQVGIIKYSFYHGGFITGLIMFFPVSAVVFLCIRHTDPIFPNLSDMVYFSLGCILISYVFAVIAYLLKWKYNERKFARSANEAILNA